MSEHDRRKGQQLAEEVVEYMKQVTSVKWPRVEELLDEDGGFEILEIPLYGRFYVDFTPTEVSEENPGRVVGGPYYSLEEAEENLGLVKDFIQQREE